MVDKSSNTTRLVDKLIKKGWVKRSTCKANRRKVEIVITEEGLTILKELDPITDRNNEKILSKLNNDQLQELNLTLDKLRTF
jgi:DNA-binding MarR family transcriptional regulator